MTPVDEPPGQWLRDVRDRRTEGRVRVRLSCDFSVDFPVEVMLTHGFGYVGPEMLGLSPTLTADLIEFQRWWEAHSSFDDEAPESPAERAAWRRWQEEGAHLVERLKSELGPEYEVDWV